jgi:hypothetical protein
MALLSFSHFKEILKGVDFDTIDQTLQMLSEDGQHIDIIDGFHAILAQATSIQPTFLKTIIYFATSPLAKEKIQWDNFDLTLFLTLATKKLSNAELGPFLEKFDSTAFEVVYLCNLDINDDLFSSLFSSFNPETNRFLDLLFCMLKRAKEVKCHVRNLIEKRVFQLLDTSPDSIVDMYCIILNTTNYPFHIECDEKVNRLLSYIQNAKNPFLSKKLQDAISVKNLALI